MLTLAPVLSALLTALLDLLSLAELRLPRTVCCVSHPSFIVAKVGLSSTLRKWNGRKLIKGGTNEVKSEEEYY